MKKSILAATIALALVGGSAMAMAGPRHVMQHDAMEMKRRQQAMTPDERLARLRADLKLTSEQEPKWAVFETALREQRQERQAMMGKMREQRQGATSAIEHMRLMSDHMAAMASGMKTVAEAAAPLYAALDASQKQNFDQAMARMGRMGGRDGAPMHRGRHGMMPHIMPPMMGGQNGMIPPPPFMQP